MPERHWDAVIVGSGFGGAVLAYRLAEAGFSVCLLERGKAYPPNSFPRSPLEVRNNFWDPSNGLYGLNNVWSFKRSAGVVASGLGGGSLIYANVLLRKDKEWFEGWPITRSDLDPHYERVERMMNVQQYPLHFDPYNQTKKATELQVAAKSLGHESFLPNLAVSFRTRPAGNPEHPDDVNNPPVVGEPIHERHRNLHNKTRYTCRLCGECDIGCNYGSKNTLDFNYLSEARRLGADIRTLSQVETFAPRPDGQGYDVTYLAHNETRRSKEDPKRMVLSCRRLILAAGTLGTTFLLMSNRPDFPKISSALGTRFSTNGDDLAFFTKAKTALRPDFGPVITTAIRYADLVDGSSDIAGGFYLEDGGNPYLLSWMVELSGVIGLARRFLRFLWLSLLYRLGLARTTDIGYRLAKLIGRCTRSSHAMPVLVMGRDRPAGKFTLKNGILDCDWKEADSNEYYDRVERELKKIAGAMDAKYVNNPFWRFDFKRVLTAHPLGGCPMGRTPQEGVVNQWGEVFGYPGLYVADGSTMPGPVGPNPSLTIAAFADRVADEIIRQGPELTSEKGAVMAPKAEPVNAVPILVEFKEVMKGSVKFGESDYESGEQGGEPLAVHLKVTTEDINLFTTDPEHRGTVAGYIKYDPFGGERPIERGEFECLVDAAGNSREIRYRLYFSDGQAAPHTLAGVKKISHDGIRNVWRDCSTLFTRIFKSHLETPEQEVLPAEAAGIIHIHPLDFVEELTTFRGEGGSALEDAEAVVKFGKFFVGALWDVYRPGQGAFRSHGGASSIPVFTLSGVKDATITKHEVTTADRLTLSMFRFQRAVCKDVVVLLHGLTTSTDMFIMPEHYNIVDYLLDNGFTDVWSLDWRGSMRYSYDLFPADFTLDDIALYDMPAAFSKIRQVVGHEVRIHVICHCVGSLAFMMSLYGKRLDGISSVISNSLSLTPRVAGWARAKLFIAPVLFPESMDLSPRWPNFPLRSFGRWLAWWISLWHPECNVRACHMVSFMWGSGRPAAWVHANLNEVTHQRTADLFGSVNMDYFRHIRKMVRKGVAVKMHPDRPRYDLLPNQYLDHAGEIDTPILFVTGEQNGVFPNSNVVTFHTLNKLKPDNRNELKVVPGYGHQDIFQGKDSARDVFPAFLDFLTRHRA